MIKQLFHAAYQVLTSGWSRLVLTDNCNRLSATVDRVKITEIVSRGDRFITELLAG